jgi:hypothetical protein
MRTICTIIGVSLFSCSIFCEVLGELILENRSFFKEGHLNKDKQHSSFTFSPEIYIEDNETIFHFKSKFRKDSQDTNRNLIDIQELYFLSIGESREIKYGISKEFWGVTETNHRVDIINQTDFTEALDGEEKLGQPMIKVSFEESWGNLDIYALLGFRERKFFGKEGRLTLPVMIDKDESVYESSAKDSRTDFAIRWSNYYDQLDIAISYFSGNSREPRIIPIDEASSKRIPLYETIDQVGVELTYLIGSLALKAEIISRSGQEERFSASTAGFEYTQVGIFESRIDLGWILEINHDDRLDSSPSVLGTRLSLNDAYDSQILSGIVWNEKSGEIGFLLESSRRVGECCLISLEGFYFDDTDIDNGQPKLFEAFKDDDFLKLEFTYYL